MNDMVDDVATESDEQASQAEPAPVATTPDLLELLRAGTAAVNLETAQPPETERPMGVTFVGIANDRIRRLYVFHRSTIAEMKLLAEEANQIIGDLIGGGDGPMIAIEPTAAWFLDMMTKTGGRQKKARRLQTIETELAMKGELVTLAGLHFWSEARMSFPALKKSWHGDIYSDWSFGIREGAEGDVGGMLSSLMRNGGFGRLMRGDTEGFDVDSIFDDDPMSDLFSRPHRRWPTRH